MDDESWTPGDLDALATEVAALARRVDQARTDVQAWINFAALAPFANPEHLPPLRCNLDGSRGEPRVPRPPLRTPPRGVPVTWTPPRGIPYPRDPRLCDPRLMD